MCLIFLLFFVAFFHLFVSKEIDAFEGYFSYVYLEYPSGDSGFDFTLVENALSNIEVNSNQELRIDESAESALSKAVASLPENSDDELLTHVTHLIRASFIGDRGVMLSKLFLDFYGFKLAESSLRLHYADLSGSNAPLELLSRRISLQNSHLGVDNAKRLYGKQNDLARLIIEARIHEESAERSIGEESQEEASEQNKVSGVSR